MFRKTLWGAGLTLIATMATAASSVNINTASAEELADKINGVGEARAQSIVDYREANGDFQSVSAIVEVDGVGEVTLKENRDRMTVSGQ